MVEITIEMKAISRKRKELLLTLRDMIASIRTQDGCASCSGYLGIENNKLISLNTCWLTQKSLDAYQASKLFSALLGAIQLLCESYRINIKQLLSSSGSEKTQP